MDEHIATDHRRSNSRDSTVFLRSFIEIRRLVMKKLGSQNATDRRTD